MLTLVIDHVVLGVTDIATSRAFYEHALAPLGVRVVLDLPGYIGFGDGDRPWFLRRYPCANRARPRCILRPEPGGGGQFYAAALAAGGQDNGEPGPRPIYHSHYYGAFVYDPDGNNIEAVCRRPVSEAERSD